MLKTVTSDGIRVVHETFQPEAETAVETKTFSPETETRPPRPRPSSVKTLIGLETETTSLHALGTLAQINLVLIELIILVV